MPVTIGFNHVATLTTDMDLTVRFYEQAFEAVVTFEVPKRDDHPWMKILDLGGGAALNVFEVPSDEIIGDRRRQGGRGAIDHYALAVESRARSTRSRSASSPQVHRRSARSNGWAMSGPCSSAIPTVWSSRSAVAPTAE
jgi:catechol 2,3-dioxygenase-like lactoylglutathione lyase family enzyme